MWRFWIRVRGTSWRRRGRGLRRGVGARAGEREGGGGGAIVVDHHAHGDADVAAARHVDTTAAAVCEPVADVCVDLLGCGSPAELPIEIAEPLYLGIATDTGWFRYSSVTPRTFRLAGDLVAAGVDHNRLFRIVEQNDSAGRLRVIGRALGGMQFVGDGRVALMPISRQDIEACNATLDDTGGFADLPLGITKVQAVAILVELETGLVKVSFRSKAGEQALDVNAVAKGFDGGGHVHAAGAKIHAPLGEATQRVGEALAAALGCVGGGHEG